MRASLLVLLLAACGQSEIRSVDMSLELRSAVSEVPIGTAFDLDVVRVWAKSMVPGEWNPGELAPLRVRLVDSKRIENDTHFQETHTYRAYAFTPGEIEIPAPKFRAIPRRGGLERTVAGNTLTLRVKGSIDPAHPGEVELPGETPTRPFPWAWVGVGLLLLAGAALALRRRPPPPPVRVAESAPPPPPPEEIALRRIEALRAQAPAAFAEELVALLREYIAAPPESTLQELAARESHEALGRALLPCDLILYARHTPDGDERARMLDSAAEFVRRAR